MELLLGLQDIHPRHRGCVLTIGAFDGVHLGHQAVLRKLREKSLEMDLPSQLITFEPLPREFFSPRDATPRLMSFREKIIALREQRLDRALRIRFSEALSHVTAQDFIRDTLVARLGIRFIMVGDDLRFGHNQGGDFNLLKEMGKTHGFAVERAPTLSHLGSRVSSTRIRAVLADSDFQLAEQLLGREYAISGKVVVGRKLGREFGVPTANMLLQRHRSPLSGVYVAKVCGDAIGTWHAVANIGVRPTVDQRTKAILEVHLLDFSGDLYGHRLRVNFVRKLREEQKFPTLDALKEAIHRDVEAARKHCAGSAPNE